ncbi:VacB/RNase II family 3'-5' exoribonuclease [Luminiphilus sp.]|nr:VacB/RNase II family 3'-5' exoribonuclease [Luminiphilus sp.]
MLDKNALNQLQGLKNKIEAEKESAEGTVKATRSRFGFVVLDDAREIFLPPDEMQRVLPGDRVSITIKPVSGKDKSGNAQTAGELETLLTTSVDTFVGEVVQKGKAFFVAPDIPELMHFSRWLFIPPNARSGAKQGDLVQCQLSRHPFADGKPAVKVLRSFGPEGTPGLENEYCAARAGIQRQLPKNVLNQIESLLSTTPENALPRENLTHLPLVTIDSVHTMDIDDALCAEPLDDGWQLTVAIADPTAVTGHAADITAAISKRGTSHYFHGTAIAMLPDTLSQHAALKPLEDRNAVVCRLTVSAEGEVTQAKIVLALVQSKAKLSYPEVEDVLQEKAPHPFTDELSHLQNCFNALRQRREACELVIEHRPEHRWIMNDEKQITSIERVEKKSSQLLVEECMVAANRTIANALKEAQRPGPFVTHAGIRRDRAEEAREFLKRYQPDLEGLEFSTLEGFRTLITALNASSDERPLRSMVNRLMARASLSIKPSPHMGMALSLYTNGTSPLRKALDYCVHLQLKAMLGDTSVEPASATVFDLLNQASAKNRQAVNGAHNWLTCNFLNAQAAADMSQFDGEIVHINTSGFTVKLDDLGLEGVVDLRKDSEKFSFDKWEMALTSPSKRYQLRQRVRVQYVTNERPRGEHPAFTTLDTPL